ncbi:hypothetical protein ABTZ03_20110 [Kitasatospora sp. NPDC096077]|uniref:hypothetical protein n=1 Tax=Kitasatospora sp. NPDC096077 TaxID=3155544 RepID=UPI00331F913B
MLLTGLSVSAGQASAVFDNPLEFGLQNKATGLCLQAVSVDCYSTDYNTHWAREDDYGKWTVIRNANGCYLKILDNKLPACVQGAPTDNGQWRTVRRHSDHHQGTEAGNGRVKWADFWGRGKGDDYITIGSTGAVTVWPNNGGDGHGGWGKPVQVATGITTNQNAVVLGDFTGDNRADYITTDPSGKVNVYRYDGGSNWTNLGQVATGA